MQTIPFMSLMKLLEKKTIYSSSLLLIIYSYQDSALAC